MRITQIGSRNSMPPMMSIQMRGALGDHPVEQVDAHVLVHLERIGAAEQHHAGEHVPLHFEPGVGACAEQIAARRIAGADQAGQEHEPVGDHAETFIERVDCRAETQEYPHAPVPPDREPAKSHFGRSANPFLGGTARERASGPVRHNGKQYQHQGERKHGHDLKRTDHRGVLSQIGGPVPANAGPRQEFSRASCATGLFEPAGGRL